MGMTLNIYIFWRSLKNIVFFCLGAAALAFLADFTEFTNRTGDLPEFSTLTALAVVAMRVPFIIQVAIPFIVLFATMATLMALNQKYELVVARASGVSAWQFLKPIWVSAVIVGLFTMFVINPLAATGFAKAEAVEGQWRADPSQNALIAQDRPWLRQPRVEGGSYLISAARASAVGTQLTDAVFLEIDADGTMLQRYDAPVASLDDGAWRLVDAVVTEPEGTSQTLPVVRIATTLDPSIITEALIPAEMVPFLSLPRQISTARSFGIAAAPFRMQFHSLIALPVLLVAMTLIAAAVSLRFARFGQSAGMILSGVTAGFVLYVVTSIAKSFGSAGLVPAPVSAWVPAIAALLGGTAYLLHREDG